MKGKKFLSLLLSGLMVVGGLTACGNTGKGESDAGKDSTGKEVSESEESSGENVTIRILAAGTDYPDVIDEAVKEKLPNVTLEWETIS